MRSWTLGTTQLDFYLAYNTACDSRVTQMVDAFKSRICSRNRKGNPKFSKFYAIVMYFLNASTELSACAHTSARSPSSSFSFSLLFFQDITPPQRDLHNCERLFVLVSWPPHTRFRTLGALLWSWFICKWLGTPAHDGAELKTDAYWTTFSLSLSSLPLYPSLFRIHTSTFILPPPLLLSLLFLILSLFLCSHPHSHSLFHPFSIFLLSWCPTLLSFFLRAPSVPRVNLKVVFLREHSGSMHFVVAISRAIPTILYVYIATRTLRNVFALELGIRVWSSVN